MSKNSKIVLLPLILLFAMLACNLPSGTPTTEISNTASSIETDTPAVNATATSAVTVEECEPSVTTNTLANVRNGPGLAYGVIGSIPLGEMANVAGKNADGTWWYIEFAGGQGGYAWIAGGVTTSACIPQTLAIIAAPPTPVVVAQNIPTATQESSPDGQEDQQSSGDTPLVIVPLLPNLSYGDVYIQEVFLTNSKQIAIRIGADPVSLKGDIQIKVFVSGALQATINDEIWSGSAVYYSGVTIPGTKLVQVQIDTANDFNEVDESNNSWNVACYTDSLTCQ